VAEFILVRPMRTFLVISATALIASVAVAQNDAPPDKPQTMRGDKAFEAYERAIAPYVAKARASYPAAKKRFLRGLPPGYNLTVFVRVYQSPDKSHKEAVEDLYVIVGAIKGGKIYGRINNRPLSLTRYRLGDPVRFPESRVLSWVVLRPDGSEEANELGNFIDHWKPPK
jgi:uncharacterized protein YegJ (DUF2314 family)